MSATEDETTKPINAADAARLVIDVRHRRINDALTSVFKAIRDAAGDGRDVIVVTLGGQPVWLREGLTHRLEGYNFDVKLLTDGATLEVSWGQQ